MSGDLDLEQRYRRVLRLLPGYDRPTRQEMMSVIGLAARLRLGGTGAPRRYFAWGRRCGTR
jgi:hypothetical protein